MPKIDPFRNRRLRGLTETRMFAEQSQPDDEAAPVPAIDKAGKPLTAPDGSVVMVQPRKSITVTLTSKPGAATMMSIQQSANALTERFVDDPMAIGVFLDGEELAITPPLAFTIATIMTLDAGEVEERYKFEEWVAISYTMPSAFNDVVEWAQGLFGRYEGDGAGVTPLPNASSVA